MVIHHSHFRYFPGSLQYRSYETAQIYRFQRNLVHVTLHGIDNFIQLGVQTIRCNLVQKMILLRLIPPSLFFHLAVFLKPAISSIESHSLVKTWLAGFVNSVLEIIFISAYFYYFSKNDFLCSVAFSGFLTFRTWRTPLLPSCIVNTFFFSCCTPLFYLKLFY